MKKKYLRPSIINAEILEFEGAFPAKAIEAVSTAAAKVLNAAFQTAQMKKTLSTLIVGKSFRTNFGLKNFQHLKFENN